MKRLKMVLYGEPGVGKSVFASKAPSPFFITTDGNYEWLEDFGAKPDAHVQVQSWEDAKKAFANDYRNYETVVVDLTEDLFKWCEYEYCKRNGYDHVSDIGFGKGYDITRNEFFIEICKLLNLDKNVILIMHGLQYAVKDRRGVEHTKFGPTNRIPDKVIDMIEGRVRYFLRAYLKNEEVDGELVKRRYLSLVPKENEFGIIRGIDENKLPQDIPLEFSVFAKAIGLTNDNTAKVDKQDNAKKEDAKVVDKIVIPVESTSNEQAITSSVVEQHQNLLQNEASNDEKLDAIKDKLAAVRVKLAEIKAAK